MYFLFSILDHNLDISNPQDNFEWALSQLGTENFNYSYDYEEFIQLYFSYMIMVEKEAINLNLEEELIDLGSEY